VSAVCLAFDVPLIQKDRILNIGGLATRDIGQLFTNQQR
jgi:hypothetical protein